MQGSGWGIAGWGAPTVAVVLLASSLVSSPASAGPPAAPALPPAGVGFVGLSAGVRTVPDAPFRVSSEKLGRSLLRHGALTPEVLVPLSYRIDAEWAVFVEGGAGRDGYTLADGGHVGLTTFTIQAGFQRAFDLGLPRLEPFVSGGVGYYLSWARTDGGDLPSRAVEAHTNGGFLGAGLRLAMTGDVGLVMEDRYAFAFVGLEGVGDTSVGGNTASLGLYYVWREDGR